MKKVVVFLAMCSLTFHAKAQSDAAQQLLLNWEKLAQFKKILQNMYDGYKTLHKGYTAVKDVSEGNFQLHKIFLDGLSEVSPAVRKYRRIADIINYQLLIVRECKAAFSQFKNDKQFTPKEIENLGEVYKNLFQQSGKSLDELAMVITSGQLRMSDDERLQAIDRIYASVEDQHSFLKNFNGRTAMLSLQRKLEEADIRMSRKINSSSK